MAPHQAMEEYMAWHKIEMNGPAIEEYTNDPTTVADASELNTKIYYPIKQGQRYLKHDLPHIEITQCGVFNTRVSIVIKSTIAHASCFSYLRILIFAMSTVNNNDTISLHYSGTLNNGEQFDSSEGREPLKFEVGAGQVIPGFDKAVLGMKKDEQKKFTIPAAEAYGEAKEELVYEVPKASIPAELNPSKGQRLVSNLEDGRQIPVTVSNVTEDTITLDANHPLAGQDLTFDIKIVDIH